MANMAIARSGRGPAISRRTMMGTTAAAVPVLAAAACAGPDQAAAPAPGNKPASLIMHTDWLTGPRGEITTQSLAEYALGTTTVVNQSLAGTKGSVMVQMSGKDVRSSIHVPVEVAGVRATVNFWSAEAAAFPPQAVKLLEQVARLMAEGSTAVAAK